MNDSIFIEETKIYNDTDTISVSLVAKGKYINNREVGIWYGIDANGVADTNWCTIYSDNPRRKERFIYRSSKEGLKEMYHYSLHKWSDSIDNYELLEEWEKDNNGFLINKFFINDSLSSSFFYYENTNIVESKISFFINKNKSFYSYETFF